MSAAVLRGIARLAPALRLAALPQRAGIATKPARSPVSTVESIIGFSTLTIVMLLPAGWFLTNIESFKKQE
ncbi:cytochrome c oxidase subunit 8A, mitochondrial [Narcine bancroftii]|uniref:cytochrome c oxidase subunit 8A, mitochondrial n=1 Tax=Narcine bancroftii TaxID=1343680 RepID=UPI0038321E04